MVACLRSTRFLYPDRSASVFLELRRQHDLQGGHNAKKFTVTRRANFGIKMIINKTFDTINEARRHWMTEASILEDQGLIRHDFFIANFHEEN